MTMVNKVVMTCLALEGLEIDLFFTSLIPDRILVGLLLDVSCVHGQCGLYRGACR